MRFTANRRKISALLILVLLVSTLMPVMAFGAATQLKDIADSYAHQEIQALVESGVISGYDDHTFQPKKAMTRAELAKIIVLSLGLEENSAKAASFEDVAENSWYRGFVGALVGSGITKGTSPTTYNPNANVTREELVVFFVRAFGLEDTAKKLPIDAELSDLEVVSTWAQAHVSLAFKMGFINGSESPDGKLSFNPKENAERQALARLAYEFTSNQSTYVEKAKEIASAAGAGAPSTTTQTTPSAIPGASGGGGPSSDRDDDDSVSVPSEPAFPTTPGQNGVLQVLTNGQPTDSIFVGEPTELTFRIALNTSSSVTYKVYKVDTSINQVQYITTLYDDGDSSHGDSIQGDGIFSGTTVLTASEEGSLRFDVPTDLTTTYTTVISAVNHLTEQQFTQAISVSDETQAKLDELVGQYGNTQQAKEEAVTWLQAQPGVEEAGISGTNGSVWYVLDSGILGGVSTAPEDSKGSESDTAGTVDELSLYNQAVQSIGQTSESLGSKKVAVISPFAATLPSASVYDSVYNLFKESEYPFNVERIKNSAADVAFFKGLNQYGVVVLDTHGDTFYDEKVLQKLHTKYGIDFKYAGPQVIFMTGEKATVENRQKHELDLKTGRLAIISGYYAVTPSFITRYDNLMPETIVFNGSCRSLYNSSMSDAFINNGAQTYYGYTDYVKVNYDQAIVQSVFDSLVNQDKTTAEAFQAAVAAHGANDGAAAAFAMKGSSLGLKTTGVVNGTFEDGTWRGWNGTGDVRVIPKLGPIAPASGSYMGIISTGLGFENNDIGGFDYNSDSYIEQNFVIPNGVSKLSFDYNFISEEPIEFVGNIYNDTFLTTVTSNVYIDTIAVTSTVYGGGTVTSNVYGEYSVIIAEESINGSTEYWVESNKVDVDFYGGDKTAYMTGWKHVSFDVSKFVGQKTFVLRFRVFDQGDSIFDTAVLIDNIKLE
ncbi:S-layer homology domain-containing protein [Paenibacillus turpanensis]|uniref:S-layer homology domain-containing protein n=1 Tax=Paenibacillus turpanensis TaxID=2689078 RepID=UPI00140C95A8|nr:S-layer homology domain-containing protein [Paenibacillus turpanensis]